MLYTQKKYKITITIISLILTVLSNACSTQKYSNKFQPTAKDGVLDLHDWDFDKDGPVELNGDWEFYWKKLIPPEVFKKNQAITERELIYVPGNWNNHTYKNQSHDGFGYATYRLKVLLGKNYNDLSFKIMTISTSYIFFVNGLRITSEGIVGTTAETARPEYRISLADYVNEAKELDIVLHISNFTHSQGGLWDKIIIGAKKQIYRLYLTETCIELFMIGSMLIIALYHLVVYLFRKKYIAPLFFTLLCLEVCLRTLFSNNYIIKIIFPDFPVYLIKRLEHLIVYLAPSILLLYVSSLFKNNIKKIILYSVLFISFLFSLLLFTPESFFPQFLMYAQMFALSSFCYILYTAFKSIIQKEEGAKLFTIGLIMLFLFFINDTLYVNYILMILPNTIPFGILLFIIIQSVILAKRFSNAFTTVETLSFELKDYSQNLEKKVEERTEELEEANDELLQKNLEITIAQDKIKERDRQKSRFLANMSHELRTPLNSINGIAELLLFGTYEKNEEIVEKIKNILNSLNDVFQNNNENHELSLMINNLKSVREFIAEDGNLKRYFFLDIKEKLEKNNFFDSYVDLNNQIEEIFDTIETEEKEMFNAYKRIKDSGGYLLELINSILNLSKIEAGKIEVIKSQTSIKKILRSVIDTGRDYAKTKQKEDAIDFHTYIEDSVPDSLMIDEQKIKQVLLNYLSNAIKFTKKGDVTLSVQKMNRNVRFSVKDSGMGIKEEDKVKIFQEFERTENTRDIDGTGLGLAISKKLIELHGGCAGFESEFGKGSTFWFEIQCHGTG